MYLHLIIRLTGWQQNFPVISADATCPHMEPVISEFLDQTLPLQHLINIYSERIAPRLSKHCDTVWDHLRDFQKIYYRKHTEELAKLKTHYISQAVHFNVDGQPHQDSWGAWCGFDCVAVVGKYEGGRLRFPELGCSFPSRPGDVFFFWGAGLKHQGRGWAGEGQMVLAYFADRRIFLKESIHRPKDLQPVYGRAHAEFRQVYPYIDFYM